MAATQKNTRKEKKTFYPLKTKRKKKTAKQIHIPKYVKRR
jgi:hypothetical protein